MFTVQLANDHAKKVEGYEAKLQEHLRVKQEAFEEAFAREMANYRQYGSTDSELYTYFDINIYYMGCDWLFFK